MESAVLEALSLEQEEADRAGNDLVQTVEECVSSGAVSLELIQTAAGGDLICLYYELTLPENWTAAWSALHQDAGALAFEAQCSAAEGMAPDYRATAVTGFDAAARLRAVCVHISLSGHRSFGRDADADPGRVYSFGCSGGCRAAGRAASPVLDCAAPGRGAPRPDPGGYLCAVSPGIVRAACAGRSAGCGRGGNGIAPGRLS